MSMDNQKSLQKPELCNSKVTSHHSLQKADKCKPDYNIKKQCVLIKRKYAFPSLLRAHLGWLIKIITFSNKRFLK